jgi:uncharacterized protein (TIGR02145 family)
MKTKLLIISLLVSLLAVSCKKDKGALSSVETYTPKYIASKAATIGCYVASDGGSAIVTCGLYISTAASPETSGIALQMGNDTGLFMGQVTGLNPATQYFIKAFAKNSAGESLGEELSFTTPATVSDYDNNVYETVKIGNQIWMAKNLKTSHYLNGDPVNSTTAANQDISTEVSPAYHWAYDGNETNTTVYGKLYTWYAVTDSRKVCPTGWHMPSDAEWTILETALGGYTIAGSRLKEYGNAHWLSPYNTDASNESCFTVLPGGYRGNTGTFFLLQNSSYLWTKTASDANNSWSRLLEAGNAAVGRTGLNKASGASVRCVMD